MEPGTVQGAHHSSILAWADSGLRQRAFMRRARKSSKLLQEELSWQRRWLGSQTPIL
jgi:hypothetical protein